MQPTNSLPTSAPTSKTPINWFKTKKYLGKTVSIVLILNGLSGLGLSLFEIFSYTNAIQAGASVVHSQFQSLLKEFIVKGIQAIVESGYGLALLVKPSEKVKLVHIFIGIILFFLPFLIGQKLVNQVEKLLPQVKISNLHIQAQETSPEKALADYQFQLQKYREAHQQYLSAKNAFLSFQTLNSRTEAVAKTKSLLIQRAETLRSYLFALRIYLRNSPGKNTPQIISLADKLKAQESFLVDQQKQLEFISAVEDVTKLSRTLEETYPQIQVLAYQSLFALLSSYETFHRDQLENQLQNLSQFVNTADDQEIDKAQINQWLSDIQNSLDQNPADLETATKLMERLSPSSQLTITNQRTFNKALTPLEESINRLIQVTHFFNEAISKIKYG